MKESEPDQETSARLEIRGERLICLPEGALWWPSRAVLFIADPHFGKAAVFRRAGIPLPEGNTQDDLKRLEAVLKQTRAERLAVLGDFLHGKGSWVRSVDEALASWRRKRPGLQIDLVLGNHDLRAGLPPEELNITVHSHELCLGPFICRHDPAEDPRGHVLCGHLHPAVRLGIEREDRMQLPCFHQTKAWLTLPAFGSFTGTSLIRPSPHDRIYAIAGARVSRVPNALLPRHERGG